MWRTQGLIVLLPGGGKLLKAFVTDLSLVKLLSVARELMKNDVAIALFGNTLPRLLQGFGHCEKWKILSRKRCEFVNLDVDVDADVPVYCIRECLCRCRFQIEMSVR